MASKIESFILNGHEYFIWAPDMETLLKSKGLWKYTNNVILVLVDAHTKFIIVGKKHEAVEIITTYISREIRFHTSTIDCPHDVFLPTDSPNLS